MGLACLITGCAPHRVDITAAKDPTFTRETKRLVVIDINTVSKELDEFTDSYKKTLAQRITNCNVALDVIDRMPLAVDLALDNTASGKRADENRRIQQFRPDTILRITEATQWAFGQNGRIEAIDYKLDLLDTLTQKTVWKGSLRIDTDYSDPGAVLANAIVGKLAQDEILRSCAPAAS